MTQTASGYVKNRLGDLTTERSSWVPHWRELMDSYSPRRGRFLRTDRNKGTKKTNHPNNTPLFARRTLASGMMTGITSPARPWFRLGPGDPGLNDSSPVRAWLDLVQRTMYQVFASSNLYKALPTIYSELGVIGTAAMIQEDDFDHVSRFTTYTAGEYMLGLDGNLKVNTFGREFQLTVSQIIDKFGIDNVSSTVRNLYDRGNTSAWIDVDHLIEPVSNKDFDEFNLPEKFRFRSVHFEPGGREDKFLSVEGYEEFPVHAPRWSTVSGDTYGESPGMEGLGDARVLQVQEKEKGKAVAKMVAPPTLLPADLAKKAISVLPGASLFSDDVNNVGRALYQVDPRVYELNQDISRTEERINRAFYVDLFLMLANSDRRQITATEVAERHEEKLLMLGPVLESLHDELLDPLIDNTFNRLVRLSEPGWNGMSDQMVLPPPPEELVGTDLKVDYISLLAQAQKGVTTGATERWIGFTGQLAQFKPEALDKLNTDEIVETMAEDLGVPNNMVLSHEDVDALRQQRAQQEQAMSQQANMAGMVQTAKDAAQIDTAGANPIADLIASVGASQGTEPGAGA